MKKQYAHMVGSICLDKSPANQETGKGQPITFEIWQVYNGSFFPGHNSRDRRLSANLETIEQAQRDLHRMFQVEMIERNYEFRADGMPAPWAYGPNNKKAVWRGETGYYDLNNPSNGTDYPESAYPLESGKWVEKQMTGYNYDNYKIVITTSNRDIVSL